MSSQRDFMERLIYSTAIHTILLVPLNPSPLSFSLSIFLFISFHSCSSPFSTSLVLSPPPFPFREKKSTKPPQLTGKISGIEGRELELGRGIDRVVRHSRGVSS